jgi:hypothetical protein
VPNKTRRFLWPYGEKPSRLLIFKIKNLKNTNDTDGKIETIEQRTIHFIKVLSKYLYKMNRFAFG